MTSYTGNGANNSFYGGTAADTAFGGDGNDRLYGGGADDTLSGDAGNDFLFGGDANDALFGGDGIDSLFGGAGGDIFDGGAGNDSYFGGSGVDTADYSAATAGVTVDLSGISDFATGDASVGRDFLVGIEMIVGSAYDDAIIGDAQANTFVGGAGNDVFKVEGADTIADFNRMEDVLDVKSTASVSFVPNGADMLVMVGSDIAAVLQGLAGESTDPADWHVI